ncbi:WD40 repeat-like protein [Rhizopogon vinicolor AM-OR11-026]|uniref:WD40 repeat-like protein n=1 Tax=Rhizopogon vinicolor AM-OR11-026 TaxID=1314800 RepID=A0A1B7MJL2_9AGAM|nr:WD40 repeat-like protein [Rhizopogon vinicolor AM-OR11-026]
MSTLDEASTLEQPRPTPKHEFNGHEGHISSFVFLHDDVHIVSGSRDGTMRKWDCDTGLLVGGSWESEGGSITALALSPDGKTISCGRYNGWVEMWNTDGEMNEGILKCHSRAVRALSWSPSGNHIASGSYDETILIRKAGISEVEPEVGPIRVQTRQGGVDSLAYSHSGDRIASGGNIDTICIWNSNTGELLVGPIKDLGWVGSVVWSLDDSKLYSASHKFARVFDSTSGTELHRFEHDSFINSVALSLKHNVLACVGYHGIAQLWDTESHQPLGLPLSREIGTKFYCLSFSRDGRYLAYGGDDEKITLWMVKDIAPALPSPPPSCLAIDATNLFTEEGHDDVYDDFFRSSEPSHPYAAYGSPRHSHAFSARRLWNALIPSRRSPPAQSLPPQPLIKRSFFARHAGPRPVTVSAARPKKLYFIAPRPVLPEDQSVEEENGNTNSQTGQSSSAAARSSAAAPSSMPQGPQHILAQSSTRPTQEDGYDYGCWGNFLHAVCCIPDPRA